MAGQRDEPERRAHIGDLCHALEGCMPRFQALEDGQAHLATELRGLRADLEPMIRIGGPVGVLQTEVAHIKGELAKRNGNGHGASAASASATAETAQLKTVIIQILAQVAISGTMLTAGWLYARSTPPQAPAAQQQTTQGTR